MKALSILTVVFLSACLMPPMRSSGGGNYAGSPSARANDSSPAAAMATSAPATSSTPAPAGPVSVTIRSACSKTVKVFFGDKPKYGSGTYSSIDSNSVQSHSFRSGEMFWIVDESQNGLGSTSVGAGTRELEIASSCTAISSR